MQEASSTLPLGSDPTAMTAGRRLGKPNKSIGPCKKSSRWPGIDIVCRYRLPTSWPSPAYVSAEPGAFGMTPIGVQDIMAAELSVGDQAPEFALPNEQGKVVRLADLSGSVIVLYFYPKDDTPGCTKEACAFRDAIQQIQQTRAVVLGVSMDSPESHQKFIAKYGLPFSLLSDREAEMSRAYGVYRKKNLYGKISWGIERSTFVIDRQGKIMRIYRKVKVDGHVDDVLSVLQS